MRYPSIRTEYTEVDPAILGKQIAYELYNRDYSYYDAKDFTIRNERSTSQTPLFELLERVAEDDTNSFTLEEWISLYSKAKELSDVLINSGSSLEIRFE